MWNDNAYLAGDEMLPYEETTTGAFVTIDVQKMFCHVARGRWGWLVPDQIDINHSVRVIGNMLESVREKDISVVHTRSLAPDADEYSFYRIQPDIKDMDITKHERSAFDDMQSTSVLDAILKAKNTDRIVLSGFWLEQCVQSTAQSALSRGFRVAVMRDGCSPLDYTRRLNALDQMKEMGVDIIRAHDVLDYLA